MDNSIQAINKRLTKVAEKIKILSDEVDTDFEIIEDCMMRMPRYFNSLIAEDIGLTLASVRYSDDPEMLKYTRENLDRTRRTYHISMADGINIINRFCTFMETDKIFEIEGGRELDSNNSEDRELAADMCYNFCKDAFLDAKNKEILWEKGLNKEAFSRNERENQVYEMMKTRTAFSEALVKEKVTALKGDNER